MLSLEVSRTMSLALFQSQVSVSRDAAGVCTRQALSTHPGGGGILRSARALSSPRSGHRSRCLLSFVVCLSSFALLLAQVLLADSNKELDGRILERREADDREFKRIDDSVRGGGGEERQKQMQSHTCTHRERQKDGRGREAGERERERAGGRGRDSMGRRTDGHEDLGQRGQARVPVLRTARRGGGGQQLGRMFYGLSMLNQSKQSAANIERTWQ